MKEIVVVFDQSVILPCDGMIQVETFGYIFPKSDLTKPNNIRTYTKHYVFVMAELLKDKTIEFIGKQCFKKNGKVFYLDDDIWEEYDKMANKSGVQFAILEIEDTEVSSEERYEDFLLTSNERWERLKDRDDVVWQQ